LKVAEVQQLSEAESSN